MNVIRRIYIQDSKDSQTIHKNRYKQIYIAGSGKCSSKYLSLLFINTLTVLKKKLKEYRTTIYSRSGVKQMLIF